MSSRTVLFATAGAAALFALTACTPSGPAKPVPPAPSSSVASAAAPASSATASTGAGAPGSAGQGGSNSGGTHVPSWSGVDFAAEAFAHTRCVPGETKLQVYSVKYADLTGDGRTEALVTAACPTASSQNPIAVYVFDGRERRRPLTLLAAIGADHELTEVKTAIRGNEVTIDAQGLSAHAALCCPDLRITETWAWRGGHLVRISAQQRPL